MVDPSAGYAASVMPSTVNTARTNPGVYLFGHALARKISSDRQLCERTDRDGKRWLTRAQRTKNDPSVIRWIKYRFVCFDEIRDIIRRRREWQALCARTASEVENLLKDHETRLIHVVVTPLDEDGTIVTNYFQTPTGLGNVNELLEMQLLQFLQDDDPNQIRMFMQDEAVVSVFKEHFETGDMREGKTHLHKTASKMKAPLNLLLHCCENNLPNCVALLLKEYSQFSPRAKDEPWMLFVEPQFPADSFCNTAFHSAAYTGNTECLEHLVAWAAKHQFDITELKPKGETALQVAERRGKLLCYNILAPLFKVPQKPDAQNIDHKNAKFALVSQYFMPGQDSLTNDGKFVGVVSVQKIIDSMSFDGLSYRLTDSVAVLKQAKSLSHQEWKLREPISELPNNSEIIEIAAESGGALWSITSPDMHGARIALEELNLQQESRVLVVTAQRFRTYLPQDKPVSFRDLCDHSQVLFQKIEKCGGSPATILFCGDKHQQTEFDVRETDEEDIFAFFLQAKGCFAMAITHCRSSHHQYLYVIRAIRKGLEDERCNWEKLHVLPVVHVSPEDSALPEFVAELPAFVQAMWAHSKINKIGESHSTSTFLYKELIPKEVHVWADLFMYALNLKLFVWKSKALRSKPASDRFKWTESFSNALVHVWRKLLDSDHWFRPECEDITDALLPYANDYVRLWFENLWAPILVSFDNQDESGALREFDGLDTMEIEHLMDNLDDVTWKLAQMHRALPLAKDLVVNLPIRVIRELKKTRIYAEKKGWIETQTQDRWSRFRPATPPTPA